MIIIFIFAKILRFYISILSIKVFFKNGIKLLCRRFTMFSFTQKKLQFNEDTSIQKAIYRKKMVNINPTLGFEEPLGPLFPNGSKASSLVLSVPPKEAKGSTLPKGSPCQEWVWSCLETSQPQFIRPHKINI